MVFQCSNIRQVPNDKTNVTYETIDAQKTAAEEPPWNSQLASRITTCVCVGGGGGGGGGGERGWRGRGRGGRWERWTNLFYSLETSPFILMQLQITNICAVLMGILYIVCKPSQWKT